MTEIEMDGFVLNPRSMRCVYIAITDSHSAVKSLHFCYKEEHFYKFIKKNLCLFNYAININKLCGKIYGTLNVDASDKIYEILCFKL
jgi:hypothetical protein